MKPVSVLGVLFVFALAGATLAEAPPESETAASVATATPPTALPPTVLRSSGALAEPSAQGEAAAATTDTPPPGAAAPEPATTAEWSDPDATETASDTDPSALTDFRAPLEPYGVWVEDDTYGTVWVPSSEAVGGNFAPYVSAGHWALSPAGQWIWVSDYPFGWVVFHYGRWVYLPRLGWSWIPGRRYAPAWVVFRSSMYGDPYLGWAPLPPRYVWRGGRAVWLGRVPPAPYVFVSTRWVFHPEVSRHVLRNRVRTRALAERSRLYVPSRPDRVEGRGPTLDQARVAAPHRPSTRVTRILRAPATRNPEPATREPSADERVVTPRKPRERERTEAAPERGRRGPPKVHKERPPVVPVVPRRAPAKPLRKKR